MLPPCGTHLLLESGGTGFVLKRRPDAEVRFGAGSKPLYASDLSMYRQVPIGVAIPKSIEDAITITGGHLCSKIVYAIYQERSSD